MENFLREIRALGKKASDLFRALGEKASALFTALADRLRSDKKARTAAVCCAVGVAAAAVLLTLWLSVWRYIDVTVLVSDELMAYLVSASDVSASDVSSADAVSSADISFSDVSSADVSGTDSGHMNEIALRLKRGALVSDALAEAGITVDNYVYISAPLESTLSDGQTISASLMVGVTVMADGVSTELITRAATVADVLTESGITLGEHDRLSCAAEKRPMQDMLITVYRVTFVDDVRTERIPFETLRRENPDMLKGREEVVSEGSEGEKKVTYRQTFVDGILESEEMTGEEITVLPVNRIVEYGTKTTTTTTRATTRTTAGKHIVSKEKVYDCDGSGHGYYIITYSDGSVRYEDF